MRTFQEIQAKARDKDFGDLFGTRVGDIIEWLPFDMAREWLKETAKVRTRKVCSCGVPGCRKRKGHDRLVEEWTEYTGEIKTREVALSDVGPGHHLWDRLRIYAAEDAEAAVELWEKLRLLGRRNTVHNPFFTPGGGPGHPGA